MTKPTIDTTNLSQEDIEQLEAIKAKAEKSEWINNWSIMAVEQNNEAYEFHGMYTVELRNMYFTDNFEAATYIAEQLEIYAQLLEAYVRVVGDWRPDWDNEDQDKHSAYRFNGNRRLMPHTEGVIRLRRPHGFSFPDEKSCEQWAGMIGHLLPKLGV